MLQTTKEIDEPENIDFIFAISEIDLNGSHPWFQEYAFV